MKYSLLERKQTFALDLTFPWFSGADETLGYAQGFKYMRRCFWNGAALGASDAVAIILALLMAGALRKLWLGAAMLPQWSWLAPVAWLVIAAWQRLLPGWGTGTVEELRRTMSLLAMVYGGAAMALFLTKESEHVSRLVLLGAFIFSLFLVPLARAIAKQILIRYGVWGVPAVVYADPKTAASVIQSLRDHKASGYVPVGVFSDDQDVWGETVEGAPVLGPSDLATSMAPVAIVGARGLTRERAMELLDGPLASYRRVIVLPDLFDVQSLWARVSDLGGQPGLEMSLNLLDPMARWSKQVIELALVLITLPFWGSVCLLLAALVWLTDRASPFFLQERVGKNGKRFRAYKFRTMAPNAEELLRMKLTEDPQLALEWSANFKLRQDPRITRIGAILRRTSLDELPQLINVLKLEMSLVGPRPLPAYHNRELTAQVRALRERVLPGLTGLWQVSGRGRAGTAGMEKWDAFYVRNWSIWLDIVILARTVKVVSEGTGAY
jgi:Undecaprenyl-phosphate galactose phosphotransferase WbaP